MIFSPELARLVMRGRKTQTRRLIRTPTIKQRKRNRPPYLSTPWRPRLGHREPIQPGRGKHALGHLIITAFEQQPLSAITPAAAIAEGFRNRPDFARYWMRLHEPDFNPGTWTHDGDTLEWFLEEWGDTVVWAITFELERDLPRWLVPAALPEIDMTPRVNGAADGPPTDTDLGYTNRSSNAMRDEGPSEAVDRASQERYSKIGRENFAVLHAEGLAERQARTLARRVREAALAAGRAGIDTSPEIAAIEQQLEIIERKRIAA